MPSKRLRFEIFKRDNFTCRYCGRTPPIVVLELDHICPKSKGGLDDEMNLATSCMECNRGKADKLLSQQMTGADPSQKLQELRERKAQLSAYHKALKSLQEAKEDLFQEQVGQYFKIGKDANHYLRQACDWYPAQDVAYAFRIAIQKTGGYESKCKRYFFGILRNWRIAGGREASERTYAENKND
jgi:HNH endonuclease